jgi:hypothetical protein
MRLVTRGCFEGQSAHIWCSGSLSNASKRFFKPSGELFLDDGFFAAIAAPRLKMVL